MIRIASFIFALLVSHLGHGQKFHFPTPDGWGDELISFPIDFAPSITYKGEEHLRFTPGWGKPESGEFWSYCFVWWIEGDSKITSESLEKDLQAYYAGLVGRNITSRNIDAKKVIPTEAAFKKESSWFEGTIKMLDYMGQEPIVLNVKVEEKFCAQAKRKAIFISVSPQAPGHGVWQSFEGIWKGFRCEN